MTRRQLTLELDDIDGVDDNILEGTVTHVRCNTVELVHDFAGSWVSDLTEDGVLALQPGGGNGGDEELRTVGAAAHLDASVCHGELVRLVEVQVWVDFVVELVARSADALAQGIAALNHEVSDDAVEDGAVVQRGLYLLFAGLWVNPGLLAGGKTNEVLHGLRGVVTEEVNLDVAEGGVDGRLVRRKCSHGLILSFLSPQLMFLATRTVNKRPRYPRRAVFA